MSTQVTMPQLGESVVEGTVSHWLVAEGEPVKEYEPLVAITTDKVDTDIPAPASGVLLRIYVQEGETVEKGALLAEIGEAGEAIQSGGSPAGAAVAPGPRAENGAQHPAEAQQATPLAQRMAEKHGLDLSQVAGTGPGGRITKEDVEAYLNHTEGTEEAEPQSSAGLRSLGFISPAVGRLAGELGVDLTQVIGTGAAGRITKKDVLAYVAAPVPREPLGGQREPRGAEEVPPWERPGTGDLFKPTDEPSPAREMPPAPAAAAPPREAPKGAPIPAESELVPLNAIRRSIARHMVISKQTSPHVTTVMEADMTRVVRARERLREEMARQDVNLTFTPFFIQAIVAGLKAVREANSTFTEEGLLIHKRVHVGMAVAVADGLIVPVIRDADEKSVLGLARAVNDLAERARAKKLSPDEVQGGTFTLTNHGTSGSLFATPIINQPQAGILGVGAIQKRAVVISRGHPLLPDAEDTIAIRPMVYLSLTFDHRVLDGRAADGFLAAVKQYLEEYPGS